MLLALPSGLKRNLFVLLSEAGVQPPDVTACEAGIEPETPFGVRPRNGVNGSGRRLPMASATVCRLAAALTSCAQVATSRLPCSATCSATCSAIARTPWKRS